MAAMSQNVTEKSNSTWLAVVRADGTVPAGSFAHRVYRSTGLIFMAL